jgi:hypothetical protein
MGMISASQSIFNILNVIGYMLCVFFIYVCMFAYMYVCMYVCMCVCYIYIYIQMKGVQCSPLSKIDGNKE